MDRKKTIAEVNAKEFQDRNVLVRVDFNVPLNDDGSIGDDSRIRAALPTIEHLRQAGAKILLVSHLGRPKGRTPKYSLAPVAKRLSELLGTSVPQLEHCVGEAVKDHVSKMKPGDIVMLENVRFHEEEEKNDQEFAKQLASHAHIYVNDAFGTAHRAHASTEGVAKHLKPALAGLLMSRELAALSGLLQNPPRPFATIIGGSKVSTKIGVLENLIERLDVLVIGGAMAFTFLKAQGKQVGKSLVEDDKLDFCRQLLNKAADKGVRVILPEDVVCAPELKAGVPIEIVSADNIPSNLMGLDVGPATLKTITSALQNCKAILWNGPLGAFETAGFEKGTYAMVDLLKELTDKGVKTVVGGGDSVAAIENKMVDPKEFTHVSTGGGACLEFLEGCQLPGVACLDAGESVGSRS